MSHYRHKRDRSRSQSRSSISKREYQQNRNNDRSKDYGRRGDSCEYYHHNHQSIHSNRQYNYRYLSDLPISIDEMINNPEEYPPLIQTLLREILLERKRCQLIEEKLNMREREYAILNAQHDQILHNISLLKHDYDQCRIDLKNSSIELNELRHDNHQLRMHIGHLLNDERQQTYTNEEMFYTKRQRKH